MRPRLVLTVAAFLLPLASALLAFGTVECALPPLEVGWRTPLRVATLALITATVVGVPLLGRQAWRRRRPASSFPMRRLLAAVWGAGLVMAFVFAVPPGPAAALRADLTWLHGQAASAVPSAAPWLDRSDERTPNPTPPSAATAVPAAPVVAPRARSPGGARQRGERVGVLSASGNTARTRNVEGSADLTALRAIESDLPLVWMTAVPRPPEAGLGRNPDRWTVVPAPDGSIVLTANASPADLVGALHPDTGAWSGWRAIPPRPAMVTAGLMTAGSHGLLTVPLHALELSRFPERDFLAYDVTKGATRFQTTCKGPGAQKTRPGIATPDRLYVGCGEDIVALDANDGHETWRHPLARAPVVVGEVEAYGTDVLAVLPEKNLVVATIIGRGLKAPLEGGMLYGLDATTGQERWQLRSTKMWSPDFCTGLSWSFSIKPWWDWVLGGRLRLVEKSKSDGASWFQSVDVVTGALAWERRRVPGCALMGIDTVYEMTQREGIWSVQATGRDGSALGTTTTFATIVGGVVAEDGNLWVLEKVDATEESYVTNVVRVSADGAVKRWVVGGDPVGIVDLQRGMLTTREAYATPQPVPVLARWRLNP